MNLDLRIPMGLMFTLIGSILMLFGMKTNGDAELYAKSMGINANLWWGLILLVFGLMMFILGNRRQRRLTNETAPSDGRRRSARGH